MKKFIIMWVPPLPPLRALPAFFLFLCTFTQYVTRVSINVAILDMTRNASALCRGGERSSSGVVVSDVTGHEVFCWTESQKGLVKGAFYFGYPWLQGRNCDFIKKPGERY